MPSPSQQHAASPAATRRSDAPSLPDACRAARVAAYDYVWLALTALALALRVHASLFGFDGQPRTPQTTAPTHAA